MDGTAKVIVLGMLAAMLAGCATLETLAPALAPPPPASLPPGAPLEAQLRRLADIPLWRLLVMLHDAERTVGSDSQTARTLARIIRERMQQAEPRPSGSKGGAP